MTDNINCKVFSLKYMILVKVYLVVTDNLHGIMLNKNMCCALLTDNQHFQAWLQKKATFCLKLVPTIFIKFLFFHQMTALQKLWKMFLFHQKSAFHSWGNQNFLFPSFPPFLPVGHCFRGGSKINLKVYDAIMSLNKNSITHFV